MKLVIKWILIMLTVLILQCISSYVAMMAFAYTPNIINLMNQEDTN